MEIIDYAELASSRATDLFSDDSVYVAFITAVSELIHEKQLELSLFEDVMLDIDLSTGNNLDIIGDIVGQKRELVSIDNNPYFGFDGADNAQSFGSISNPSVGGVFYSILNNPSTQNTRGVDDETYRKLIKARILKNKAKGTINDCLAVINILADNTTSRIEIPSAGNANIVVTTPVNPLLNYFLKRLYKPESIIPIPIGVRVKVVEV